MGIGNSQNGESKTRPYYCWIHICRMTSGIAHPDEYEEDPTSPKYMYPGWRDYIQFRKWFDANVPEGYHLYRKDNSLGYFPENVETKLNIKSGELKRYGNARPLLEAGFTTEDLNALPQNIRIQQTMQKTIALNENCVPVPEERHEAIVGFRCCGQMYFSQAFGSWDEEYGGNIWYTATHGVQREEVVMWFDFKEFARYFTAFEIFERVRRRNGSI